MGWDIYVCLNKNEDGFINAVVITIVLTRTNNTISMW